MRKKAVFVVQSQLIADRYGVSYIIYPKDGFTFYWSNEIDDVFEAEWIYKIEIDKEKNKDILASYLLWCFLRNPFEKTRIVNEIQKQTYDILLKDIFGDFNQSSEPKYVEYILNTYKNANAAFIKKFYNKSSNVNDLRKIKPNSEIMIICKGYYAIRTN